MLGRSALLLAMMACLPDASQQAARVSDDVEDLLRRFWTLCPDLASPETRAAIFEDLKARCQTSGRSLAGACAELGAQLDRWANGGREPVVVYDEQTGVGDWRGRVLLQAPGQYITEVRREDGEDRTTYSQGGLPTSLAASEETVSWARRLELERATTQVSRAFGRDVSPEVAALLASPGGDWCDLRDALNREAGQLARENSVLVGVDEAGPVSPMESLSYDESTAKYGILDDLVKQPPSPEQRAKMEAWHDEVTSREGARVASGKPPKVWRSLSMTEPGDVRPKMKFSEHPLTASEEAFDRTQRMGMGMNTSADRAMVSKTGPLDFAAAGELNRRVVVASARGQAGYLEVGQDGWRSSAVVIKRSKRPAKSPEVKAEQRQRKAFRTARKSRRGWS